MNERPADAPEARFSIADFVAHSQQRDRGPGVFELETQRMLEVRLSGDVWTKLGSMVAYRGDIRFEREGMLDQGLGALLKKAVSGEMRLTRARGNGRVYLADAAKRVTILRLQGEALCVNGNDVLAFEPSLRHEIKLLHRVTSMLAGGLFNVRLEGHGLLAITTHAEPLTLVVTKSDPVSTDPNATVAWSGSLEPELKTDLSLKSFVGRGSGESLQMHFRGEGFVVVQPYEEIHVGRGAG